MQATANQGYALLIGVNDYSAYDKSTNQKKGTSDLPGSVNDVQAWWTLCKALGFRPENIRVLTSPAIQSNTLVGATAQTTGEATEKGIRDGVEWLTKNVGADKVAVGLLTYSGHGDFVGDGLVLCPTDVTGESLVHSIPYADLQKAIAAHGAGENLTVVLDSCHAGGVSTPQRKALSLTQRPVPKTLSIGRSLEIASRVYTASSGGGSAYQAEFAGRFHGAFTWALTSTLEQWKAVEQGDSLRLTVSYGEALRRAHALLTTLSFDQTPGLQGVANVADLAVLQSGLVPQPTSSEPNASPTPMQLDPGEKDYRIYTLDWSGSTIGQILVPHTSNSLGTILPGTEYWYMTANITSVIRITNLVISWVDYTWAANPSPSLGTLSFTMPQNPSWSSTSAPSSGSMTFVKNGQFGVVLVWGLTLSGGGVWGGALDWYTTSGQNSVFGGTGSTVSVTMTSFATPSVSWYRATLTP
jgi:uncharacterized caspase-like protein